MKYTKNLRVGPGYHWPACLLPARLPRTACGYTVNAWPIEIWEPAGFVIFRLGDRKFGVRSYLVWI